MRVVAYNISGMNSAHRIGNEMQHVRNGLTKETTEITLVLHQAGGREKMRDADA